jgi:hypothetical protein
MSSPTDLARLSLHDFADRFRDDMLPLGSRFSYFAVGLPLGDEDIKEYLSEPLNALPPSVASALPRLSIVLVPFLERGNGKEKSSVITLEAPPENRREEVARIATKGNTVLAFAVKDQEVADYHYRLYRTLATLLAEHLDSELENRYFGLLREEMSSRVHGEVDEESWRLKQGVQRRQTSVRRDTKTFLMYARQSFIDTMTLYLHGICCDIDVDTGPRQLPSRFLRKRLETLQAMFPPPPNYAVFPEDLKPD